MCTRVTPSSFRWLDIGCELVSSWIYLTVFVIARNLPLFRMPEHAMLFVILSHRQADASGGRLSSAQHFGFFSFPHIDKHLHAYRLHLHSLRIDTRRLLQPFSVNFYIESIKLAFQILLTSAVHVPVRRAHGNRFVRMSAFSRIIQHHTIHPQ